MCINEFSTDMRRWSVSLSVFMCTTWSKNASKAKFMLICSRHLKKEFCNIGKSKFSVGM